MNGKSQMHVFVLVSWSI